MIRVAIMGAAGRMGKALTEAACHTEGVQLSAAVERPGHQALGMDIGLISGIAPQQVLLVSELTDVIDDVDVVVDFTVAASSVETLKICADNKTAVVLGTTGFDADQNRFLDQVGSKIALMAAPNMSIGVNLVFKLLEMAAKAMGNEADVEIIEAHHHHKVDSPSGTALRMGEIVANTLGRDLEKHALYGRQGQIGARDPETIGFSTIRAGDIVGEHTVLFASTGERVEITHRASNRMNFAQGAMRAVKWIMNQPPGRYDMHDVLGLRND